jgi:hypothetical protein
MINKIHFRKRLIFVVIVAGILLLSLFYLENIGTNPSNGIDSNLMNSRFITAIGIKDPVTFKPKILKDKKYINDFILIIYQLKEVEDTIPENQLTGDVQKIVFHRGRSLLKDAGDHTMFVFENLGIAQFADKQYLISNEFTNMLVKMEENSVDGWW